MPSTNTRVYLFILLFFVSPYCISDYLKHNGAELSNFVLWLTQLLLFLANQRYGKGIEDTASYPFLEIPSLCPSNRFTRAVSSYLRFLLKLQADLTSETIRDFDLIRLMFSKIVFKTLPKYDRQKSFEAECSLSFVQFACIMKQAL